jgi:Secretion system C-terminal sorting domain
MKNILTLLFCCLMFGQMAFAQVYIDQLDNTNTSFLQGSATYSSALANGEWTVTGINTGPYDAYIYKCNDATAGTPLVVDATGNNKLYVRAKASSVGTQLRMDIQDANGYLTSIPGITKTLTTDYLVLEYDFTGVYQDGGYGGTPCAAGPCPVDGSKVAQLLFYVNPGQGGFNGTVVIDYIAFGTPNTVIMSSVFQDHFNQDSSLTSCNFIAGSGLSGKLDGNTNLIVTGDGTAGPYNPFTYLFRNPSTWLASDIDATQASNKLYVKIKSSVANTSFRVDLQDINDYLTTQGSLTKIVGTEYSVLEYDFSGSYADLGYGGSPCTANTAPCPVDPTRIKDLVIFVNPGSGMFLGELTIDYISWGISLEPAGPSAELLYEDHFNNGVLDYTGPSAGFTVTESGTEMKITGDGTAAPYGTVSYILNDRTTGSPVVVDMTSAQNKVFIKAKTASGSVPFRVDLIDTTGYSTSQAGLTKIINDQYGIYTFDFTGSYFDGGYGGTPCTTGPCQVDMKAIRQILLYVDPALGGYNGDVFLDFISIGKPLGNDLGPVGVVNYQDQLPDLTAAFITDAGGVTSSFASSTWTMTANGTSGAYSSQRYAIHDGTGELILANVKGSADKLYIRAKASVPGTVLRIDLQDNQNYISNLNAQTATLSSDYAVYEYNFAGAYLDGAYGGTPCTVSGCAVDAERVANLLFYINPATGAYNGTLSVDWISFGSPLVGVTDLSRLSSLSAYPNPVTDMLYLDFETVQSGDVDIEVYNAVGNRVLTHNLGYTAAGTSTHAISSASFAQGMYYVVFSMNGQKSGSLKFVK